MAADVAPLQQLKLPSGPAPVTAEQRYWKSFKNPKNHTTTAHQPVNHIAFPTAGTTTTTIATALKSNDIFSIATGPRVEVFSIRRREPLKTISRFDSIVRCTSIRPDSRALLASDDSGKLQVFDVAGNARAVILRTWQTHKQPVWVASWSPYELTKLMSASDDKTIRTWDLTENEPTTAFIGHQDYIRSAAYMPGNSNMLVSGSYDATVRIWDTRTPGSSVLTFRHAKPVEAVLPLPSGTTVLSSAENTLTVLDLVAAKPLRQLNNHQKTVTSLCTASHGQRVVSGGLDGIVKVFDVGSWKNVATIRYPAPVRAVAVIPAGANGDDRHLAVGLHSGTLSIKTRLSGPAAEREKERKLEVAAQDDGTWEAYEAKKLKRKREVEARKRLELIGDSVDAVIGETERKTKRETQWQKDLRHQRFRAALDAVLRKQDDRYDYLNVLTLLIALRHRSALRDALENRDETTVQPILKWVSTHMGEPSCVSVCVDVGLHLINLYSEDAGGSQELNDAFRMLHRKVRREVDRSQRALQVEGMVQSLMVGAA